MTSKPLIAVFDIATETGICVGRPGGKPTLQTWKLPKTGTRASRFLFFSDCCDEFFATTKPDIVRSEAPLHVGILMNSDATFTMLRGMIALFEASAARAGIPDIGDFEVKAARHHLTGQRTFPKVKGKSTAKAAVFNFVKMLGASPANFNESDAYAGWSYTCGLANPRTAHLVTPLFAGR